MAGFDYLVGYLDVLERGFADCGSYCITIVSAGVLYFVLAKENRRRAAMQLNNDDDRDKMAFQDLTDKENPYFMYML